jgi:hypothetical protein
MQDGGSRHDSPHFFFLAVKSSGYEHSHAHHSRIAHFDAHLCGAQAGIENGTNIADSAGDHSVRIGVQADCRAVADMNVAQVVFVHITHRPDIGKIGNRE